MAPSVAKEALACGCASTDAGGARSGARGAVGAPACASPQHPTTRQGRREPPATRAPGAAALRAVSGRRSGQRSGGARAPLNVVRVLSVHSCRDMGASFTAVTHVAAALRACPPKRPPLFNGQDLRSKRAPQRLRDWVAGVPSIVRSRGPRRAMPCCGWAGWGERRVPSRYERDGRRRPAACGRPEGMAR